MYYRTIKSALETKLRSVGMRRKIKFLNKLCSHEGGRGALTGDGGGSIVNVPGIPFWTSGLAKGIYFLAILVWASKLLSGNYSQRNLKNVRNSCIELIISRDLALNLFINIAAPMLGITAFAL